MIGVKFIDCGCFYDAVEHCAGLYTFAELHENEILPDDGKGAKSLFSIVIVEMDISISQEYMKVFSMVNAVGSVGFTYSIFNLCFQ